MKKSVKKIFKSSKRKSIRKMSQKKSQKKSNKRSVSIKKSKILKGKGDDDSDSDDEKDDKPEFDENESEDNDEMTNNILKFLVFLKQNMEYESDFALAEEFMYFNGGFSNIILKFIKKYNLNNLEKLLRWKRIFLDSYKFLKKVENSKNEPRTFGPETKKDTELIEKLKKQYNIK